MPADASAGTRWDALSVILFAGAVGAAQLGKLPAALPLIRGELGIGLVTAGWIISTIVVIGAAGSLFAGIAGDRIGHRRILIGGTLLVAAGSIAGAFSNDAEGLIASRIAEGFGYIAVVTAAPVMVSRSAAAKDRAAAFGIWSFYMPLGMSSMIALSPLVMGATGGWRGLWLLNGALAALAFATLAASLRGSRFAPVPSPTPVRLRGIGVTVTKAGPWALAVGMGAYSLVYLSSMAFLPTYLIERQGFDARTAALLVGLAVFMNAPGCYVGGRIVRSGIPPWAGIAIGYVAMAVCAAGLYQSDIPFALRYGLAMALPFFGGFIPPIVLSRIEAHAPSPELYGTAVGLVLQVVSFGQFVGPPVMAALVAASGNWQSGAWLTVAACATGLAAAGALRRLDRRAGLR